MKKMNKVAAAVLAAAMVVPMAVPAFAADKKTGDASNNYVTSDTTTVKYKVTASYEWNIHSEIDFGDTQGDGSKNTVTKDSNTVQVTKNVIGEGKKLQITVAGSGDDSAFTMKNQDTGKSKTLPYTVKSSAIGASELNPNAVVLTVDAGTNTGSTNMTFAMETEAVEVAGSYQGTVTYSASVVDQ